MKPIYGKDALQNRPIRLFPNYEEYAAYEVYDRWYSSILQGQDFNFKGAPNLFNFIDYAKLGKALEKDFDESIYLKINKQGAVVEILDV